MSMHARYSCLAMLYAGLHAFGETYLDPRREGRGCVVHKRDVLGMAAQGIHRRLHILYTRQMLRGPKNQKTHAGESTMRGAGRSLHAQHNTAHCCNRHPAALHPPPSRGKIAQSSHCNEEVCYLGAAPSVVVVPRFPDVPGRLFCEHQAVLLQALRDEIGRCAVSLHVPGQWGTQPYLNMSVAAVRHGANAHQHAPCLQKRSNFKRKRDPISCVQVPFASSCCLVMI